MPSIQDTPEDVQEELAFYKEQIAALESELADFQASSRELEQELEKELEASEKRHRDLQQKNEALRYEVDEWKTKYKQSKAEANTAQNVLQKEVTALREQNRATQLRLRDMEVTNDDFERQERIVKSSLEDLESKYNISIERAVLLEAEIHAGEAEREALRIGCQRLKDELSDMKVEMEITQEKLKDALKYGRQGYQSPLSEHSSSDFNPSTPRDKPPATPKSSTPRSELATATPPSPPISETSTTPSTGGGARARIPSATFDPSLTPRPSHFQRTRQTQGSSISPNNTALPQPASKSKSLNHVRGLIGQVQRLEQRVHSARSKLPALVHTTPPKRPTTTTPQAQGTNYTSFIPSTVTVRSSKKTRPSSTVSNSSADTTNSPSIYGGVSRLSYGAAGDRPGSRTTSHGGLSQFLGGIDADSGNSRPSSRSSTASTSRSGFGGNSVLPKPASRTSTSGIGAPLAMRNDYTMSMKTTKSSLFGEKSPRSSLAFSPERKRSVVNGGLSSGGLSSGGASGVTSDDDNMINSSPTANRRAAIAAAGIPKPPPGVRTGIPRRSISGFVGMGDSSRRASGAGGGMGGFGKR